MLMGKETSEIWNQFICELEPQPMHGFRHDLELYMQHLQDFDGNHPTNNETFPQSNLFSDPSFKFG